MSDDPADVATEHSPDPRGGGRQVAPRGPAAADRDRAVSAVVGKTLEAGIVVLYVSMLVAVLYGGVVPEYEAAASDELGERVLAETALAVQTAVPADPSSEATVRHRLPETVAGSTYRIVAANRSLRLVHEDAAVGGTVPLVLPEDVDRVEGEWVSSEVGVVRVERTDTGRVVHLEGEPE